MKKLPDKYNHIVLALLIMAASVGLVFLADFIGFATLDGEAGTIYEVNLHQSIPSETWQGVYGVIDTDDGAVENDSIDASPGGLTKKDMTFRCTGVQGNDIYASTMMRDSLNTSALRPATIEEVNNFIGYNGTERDSANNTFDEQFTIILGKENMTVEGTHTNQYESANSPYSLFPLKDPQTGAMLFGTEVIFPQKSFDDTIVNYQLMIPVPTGESSQTYYFFHDPRETCQNQTKGGPFLEATLRGTVYDNTTLQPLAGVDIVAGETGTSTSPNGTYSFTVPEGDHVVGAFKNNYSNYYEQITIQPGETRTLDITLQPKKNPPKGNGTVTGTVFDNETSLALNNVTISIGGVSEKTNASGEFSFEFPEGTHQIVALKDGYDSANKEVNITLGNTTEVNISLLQLDASKEQGLVEGYVFDEDDNAVNNATVSLAGNTTATNSTGYFNLSAPSGTRLIVSFKEEYDNFIEEVNVTGGNTTGFNITLVEEEEKTGTGQSSGQGSGSGGGSGGSGGGGGGVSASQVLNQQAPKEEQPADMTQLTETIWAAPRQIKKTISQGTFDTEEIGIFNLGKKAQNVTFEITGSVKDMIDMTVQRSAVESGDRFYTELTFFGRKRGTYMGFLKMQGDIFTALPIRLKIIGESASKGLLVNLEAMNEAYLNEGLKYRTSVNNMLPDERVPLRINYFLYPDGNSSQRQKIGENKFVLEDSYSVINTYNVPGNLSLGDYILKAEVEYKDRETQAKVLVPVEPAPYWLTNMRVLGIPLPVLAAMIALILGTGIFAFKKIRQKIKEKKRFDAKVYHNHLPDPNEDSSIFVGKIAEKNRDTYFNMDKLTVHSIVAGSTGGGKSIAGQVIVEECLKKDVAVICFDPTAQWTGMLRKCVDEHFLDLYQKFGMKPSDAKAFPGNIRAIKDGREKINVMDYANPGEIQVFTTSTLDPAEYDIFVANTIRDIFHSNLKEHDGLRILIVYDEIHRILPKYGGSGSGFTQIERACREFRKWGLGVLLISQVLSDFVGDIKANINTEVQMKTRDEGDLNRIKMKYGEDYIRALVKAPVGSGMVQNSAYNRGRPYYVTFRPIQHSTERLSDEELDKYNEANDRIDQMRYELEQLDEEHGMDVFDISLELNLATDKVKSGSFNMVKIYLDGLEPRIKKLWDKAGAEPKQLEKEYVSQEQIDKDVKKAKEENEEYDEPEEETAQDDEDEEEKEEASPEIMESAVTSLEPLLKQLKTAVDKGDNNRFIELKDEIQNTIKILNDEKREENKEVVDELEELISADSVKKDEDEDGEKDDSDDKGKKEEGQSDDSEEESEDKEDKDVEEKKKTDSDKEKGDSGDKESSDKDKESDNKESDSDETKEKKKSEKKNSEDEEKKGSTKEEDSDDKESKEEDKKDKDSGKEEKDNEEQEADGEAASEEGDSNDSEGDSGKEEKTDEKDTEKDDKSDDTEEKEKDEEEASKDDSGEKKEEEDEDASADEGSSEGEKDDDEKDKENDSSEESSGGKQELPETESSIKKMTKDDMKEYAKEEYGIELDTNNLKDEMVGTFLKELGKQKDK